MSRDDERNERRERVRRRAREHSSRGVSYLKLPSGVEFLELIEGKNLLDLLVYEVTNKRHPDHIPVGDTWGRCPVHIHRDVGSSGRKFVCLSKMGRGACPICEERKRLAKSEDTSEEELKALSPKDRELFLVIPRTGKQKDKLCVWDESYYNFGETLDRELHEGDRNHNIED